MQQPTPTLAPIGQNGLELCFQTFGEPNGDPLLLVMGYTAQMISWPAGFVDALVDRGFFVTIFDNRDSGLSAKTSGDLPDGASLMARVAAGEDVAADVPYTLADMAEDALGVLDHLGIATAHVVGASMGGMIVQELAMNYADRLRSAVSIMSTTGNSEVGQADPEAMAALLTPPPTERDAAIEHMIKVNQVIAGPLWDEPTARTRSIQSYERSFYPPGGAFQLAAIAASGDRTEGLGRVDVPFLVIHGRQDPLLGVSGGFATAEAVPGADLVVLDAMGHDVPEKLWPQMADAIMGIAQRPRLDGSR